MEEKPELQIIGVLHGDIASREDAPKNFDESERIGTLEIYPEYQDGLDGIVSGQAKPIGYFGTENSGNSWQC